MKKLIFLVGLAANSYGQKSVDTNNTFKIKLQPFSTIITIGHRDGFTCGVYNCQQCNKYPNGVRFRTDSILTPMVSITADYYIKLTRENDSLKKAVSEQRKPYTLFVSANNVSVSVDEGRHQINVVPNNSKTK